MLGFQDKMSPLWTKWLMGQGSGEWEQCTGISIPKRAKLQFKALPCTELLRSNSPRNTTAWKKHIGI